MVESVRSPTGDGLGVASQSEDAGGIRAAHCESCGRYVGAYERCPYCGARMVGRVSIRTIKIVAVCVATIGLALLWWQARRVEIPQISMQDVSNTMNLAYVRLAGRITRQLTYDPAGGYLGFWLAEEMATSEMGRDVAEVHVNVYRDVLADLLEAGAVPALGDEVTVAGTLRIREDYAALTVNVADHLEIRRAPARERSLGEVTTLDAGRHVRVVGEVRRVYRPYEGLTLITLGDAEAELVVAVDDVITALTGTLPDLAEGQRVEVEGVVTLYRSTPQLVPVCVADIEVLTSADALTPEPQPVSNVPVLTQETPSPEPIATVTVVPPPALGRLDAEDVGRKVRVSGHVVLLEGIRGGVKATLDDGTGQIILLIWDDVYHALDAPFSLDTGAEVDVVGKVALYEGALEIVPATADDVTILVPASRPDWVEVSALGSGDVGRIMRIRGVIGAPQPFSAGVKVPLDDGTGVIMLLLWSNLYEALDPPPTAGQRVEVVGTLSVFRDELELVPRTLYDWRVGPPDG